jgi:hypothetical protein
MMTLFTQQIEPNRLPGINDIVKTDWDGYQRELNVPFPDRSHGIFS